MNRRSAFARAEAFLDFSAGWKWMARLAAATAAFTTFGLFALLTLYVDLVVYRGRLPDFEQLRPHSQAHVEEIIEGMTPERRDELFKSLAVPSVILDAIGPTGRPQTGPARQAVWHAYVTDYLEGRVGESAAELYTNAVKANREPPPFGIISLALRQGGIVQTVLTKIAAINAWTWRPANGYGPNVAYLAWLAIVGVILAIIRAALVNFMNYAAATAALDAATRLRRAVYHHCSRLGTLTLREHEDNEAVAIFTVHIENVRDALLGKLTAMILHPLQFALLLLLAALLDFWLALSFVIFAAVVILLGGYLAARYRDRARYEARRAEGQIGLLRESLGLMRLVKSNLMDTFNQSRVERQLADYADASFRRFRNESLFRPLLIFLGSISAALALFLAGNSVLAGGPGPARLVALVAVLGAAYWPLSIILEQRRVIRRGRESARPIFEFLDRPAEVGQVVGAEFLPGISRQIEFRGVSLREAGSGRLLLDDINLKIKAGQRVAIVGTDDVEKHALVYLLLRFLDPTTGEVRIDEKNVRWTNLESLRAQIGLILWQDMVFNDTVANNIGCGDASVTLPQIIESAKMAHAHSAVQRLPFGYETQIGDLGSSLRRSEKFRIALARAVLKDPALYVIEEPLEALDEDNKGLVDDTLARVLPNKTVIFLAHRISTIRSCDCVYLLHRGRVVASGEHRDLLNRSELYKHLHYLEFNEFAAKT